ncbi:MAG TPA: T9SS type A sorting domain-containing protein [bacterium]|nr:T9SS type A sorting domain-containing protein [bacterium]
MRPTKRAIAGLLALPILLLPSTRTAAEPAPAPKVLDPVVVVDDIKHLHDWWGTALLDEGIDMIHVPQATVAPEPPQPDIIPVPQIQEAVAPEDEIRAKAFPNPSNGPVTVRAEDAAAVSVEVYDVAGRMLAGLDGSAGEVTWDGRDAQGRPAPSGVYFARVSAEGGTSKTIRIVRR